MREDPCRDHLQLRRLGGEREGIQDPEQDHLRLRAAHL